MFENFRLGVGLRYSRFHFRRTPDTPLRFTDGVARARRALLIFPEIGIDWESTQHLVKYFSRRFASGSVVVVIREDLLNSINATPAVKTITYTRDDINAWFLPRGSLLRKLKTSTFDVALDLNIGLSLTGAFLCREAGAPLRIGFAKESADTFYNLQVQTQSSPNAGGTYRSFTRCLDMF